MEILSSSEVQYAGESSGPQQCSGAKSTDVVLEKNQTLIESDCSGQCLETELSPEIPESDGCQLEANNTPHSSNGTVGINKDCLFQDSTCIAVRPVSDELTANFVVKELSPNLDSYIRTGDGILNEEDIVFTDGIPDKATIMNTHSLLNEQHNLSNGVCEGTALFSVEQTFEENLNQISNKGSSACLNSPHTECNGAVTPPSTSCKEYECLLNDMTWESAIEQKEKVDEQPAQEVRPCSLSVLQPFGNPSGSNIEDLDLPLEDKNYKALGATNSLSPMVQNSECSLDSSKNQEAEPAHDRIESPEQDYTKPLWVKWRGKWQTAIRCLKNDHPLTTLKAKPTHDEKNYLVIFFPHTRTYSWVDVKHVLSIDMQPQPLECGTHSSWLSLVEDLTTPQCYIMHKLAVSMLNKSDPLHIEAVAQVAHEATYWKDFAMEASRCKNYTDLGNMLVKLQSIILPRYIKSNWLETSVDLWIHQCRNAQSAESVELLTEELVASILWNDIDELWKAPLQPKLGSEWKNWKREAMKLFYESLQPCSNGDSVKNDYDEFVDVGHQISRKRPKLEIRRSEVSISEADSGILKCSSNSKNVDAGPSYLQSADANNSSLGCYPEKVKPAFCEMDYKIDTQQNDQTNVRTSEIVSVAIGESSGTMNEIESASIKRYRRCSAFIEAKGRPCGRWASDGGSYCCVHVRNQSASPQVEHSPPLKTSMCEGTTVHGKKCKHKAQHGSVFCKKHEGVRLLRSCQSELKRKHEMDNSPETITKNNNGSNNEIVSHGEIHAPSQENLIPVVIRETLDEGNCLMHNSNIYDMLPGVVITNTDYPQCIGYGYHASSNQCKEKAIKHTLYCGNHLPNFLKRARAGKSRLISKDVFINLLQSCTSREEKIQLHRACELLYSYMKNSLAHQKSISKEDHMKWLLSEASKDEYVGEYLLKLVSMERHRIGQLWGLDADSKILAELVDKKPVPVAVSNEKGNGHNMAIKCKICMEEFYDDQTLSVHWMEIHKKEAQWLFRGYACAICMNSFTNRKVLEAHVIDKHGIQFLEHSVLLRCMSCNSHLANPEKLWEHILSFHSSDFRLPPDPENHAHLLKQGFQLQMGSKPQSDNCAAEKRSGSQRFTCKLCGLKFDLLPDLGRHHQAAHMTLTFTNRLSKNRASRHLKTRKFQSARFKKSSGASFGANYGLKKKFQASSSVIAARLRLQTQASETVGLGNLSESHCSSVAEKLFSEAHKTKPYPSNPEILAIAGSACCQTNIRDKLLERYGTYSENFYMKAAKLCSEQNIPIKWHLDGFICPKGCKPCKNSPSLGNLDLISNEIVENSTSSTNSLNDIKWEMDECHYILSPSNFSRNSGRSIVLCEDRSTVICEDISFGKESVPVVCVISDDLKHLLHTSSDEAYSNSNSLPWLGFTYATKRVLDPSLSLDTASSQLGCVCKKCDAGTCDHVYLFNNDYENAKDVYGKSMQGRFPYDGRGCITLEEGYLVYECNSMCSCDKTCQNRILQNGLQIRLEIFRTENKGWAVRAGELIPRGTFVCEYIGEVLSDREANQRGQRYDNEGCSYLYNIDAHIDDGGCLGEILAPYVIDATHYGNVSRFINHSCSPNLVNYQVLVESMDCQLAHIGLYANRDIVVGEELVYNYRYKLLPGKGSPCHCGSSNCRGRLY